ncbi:TPA: hypothetical protein RQJ78_001945 [Vibrio vulnificus]|nr:hypothetical protein [Vibrio vulnificus]HAS6274646.1 hypothetical protein [Vibrio vulnificus]HAS6325300.1 hypothetical protein [Vibrio vulnificus]HAS8260966.1 hypothetical protein [Vibrio vulnificus]HAT8500469.1 hypothetical protein [Vibrio vulnificus]
MTWITLPSVSVQNGSKIVTVNNTQTTNIKVGDALLIGNYQPVEIAGVFATQLSLRTNWSNAAQANASAVVLPTFGDFNAATQALRQATQVTQGNFKTLEDWGTKFGNITFEGQDNSKHTARTLLQMDADVSELEEQANNLIVSLSGRNFTLSKAILDAMRSGNKEQYAASGFIHTGLQHKDTASIKGINEGLWTYIHESDSYRQSLRLGRLRANANSVGTSKEDFAVMNVAGFTSVLFSGVNDGFQIKFPDAPNGTVVSDSSGNCRGTGKPTLDLSKEVDPKYGDVADSVNEAVARAFEGELGNGDFRNGLTGWAFANGMEIIPNHSAGVTRFNIKTAGNGQCNNDTANNRLVRGLKYKATIYVADSSGTFFLSTLKDSAIDQQHALKNGWNEIEFTMGDSLYPVRKSNAQAGQYIDIGFFSVTALTEEVVIERVDMAGLEFFKEKVGAYLYPYGMIQSKATTVDGVATTEDTVRPITYFAVFEGDTTSRGRGWKLVDLTFVQLATIMSNPEHNAWYNEAGELMQFRGRQRSFAGLGNGDWRVINPKGDILSFGTENLTRVAAQGRLDTPASPSGGGNFFAGYKFTAHNAKPEVGMFTVSSNSGDYQAPDGECYFYVLATVPRLNQGAYHQSFNPMGTKHWNRHDASGGDFWHQPNTGNNKTTARAFYQTIVVGDTGARQPTGAIGQNSGRGDGRLYDAIYASGQGGVIDWRLPARDMGSKEDAAKVFQEVVNGTYRGFEKLMRSKPFLTTHQAAVKQSSGTLIYIDGAFEFLTKSTSKNDGIWLNLRCNGYIISQVSSNANGNYIYIHNCEGDVAAEFPLGTAVVLTTDETNLSVSGEFTQLDVVGAPADILRVDDLNNGWMGGWVPVVPAGAAKQFPYTRKNVGISGIGTDAVVSTNQGSTWTSSSISTSPNTQNIFGGSGQSIQDGLVYVAPYKAFAKQTKLSVNKPVLNGSEGIGDVFATTRGHQDDGVLFAESLISKVLTSTSAPYSQILSFYGSRFGSDGKIAQHPTAGEHVKLGIAVPTNNSPAVKALWHQASNNQQATLNLLWNELIFDTNWRTPDKVWSGGSVSVAAGETFRAESSSAYAVAGLLMRCVKALTANATVLGAMHVSVGGEVISLTDGQTYFKVVNNGWSDDSTIRIIDGVGTFNNENGDACLYGTDELAMHYGYTKNQAGAGKQVVGVDL